jgi:twinkle protein
MVVTGIPSHGKSTWVNDLCCNLARKHGLKTAFASFEQDPTEDHRRALRQWGLGYSEPWGSNALVGVDKWIDESFCFIYPTDYQSENEDLTLSWVLEKAAVAVKRFGVNVIVVDPWNELDHIRPSNMSMTDYVSYAIKQFRQFARVYNVLLIIVAHPTKLKKENGKYPIPTLYDVSDSAHWANKADVGIVIYKDRKDEQSSFMTTVSIQKIRYQGTVGMTGNINYFFNIHTKRFEYIEPTQSQYCN